MAFAQFPVEFTKDGAVYDDVQVQALLGALPECTDLIVLAHGWNHDMADAEKQYDELMGMVSKVLGLNLVTGLEGRTIGVLRVFWPSKRFADADLIPGGGAASATGENHNALIDLLQELKRNPERLGGQELDPIRAAHIDAALQLLPALETDTAARREFVLRLRAILDPSAASVDDASNAFFTRDTEALFAELKRPVPLPLRGPNGGAAAFDSSGGAAGLGDLWSGFVAAARRLVNFTTYYEMKERAGTVGTVGLAPVLRRIRESAPAVRLHLVGHSFGGRLVTAAANALADATPAVTMTLLQAAYSHNGIGLRYDGTHDGDFRAVLGKARVSGPILITHTKNDLAVGISYPLASIAADQQASAMGDRNDPYGGMGRNGAQHTPEVDAGVSTLHAVGAAYAFAPGKVYNLNADAFISNHGDVMGAQVAYAVLSAMRSV
ncbi:MAG: hypothetical protein ABI212_10485 [Burkholderiaceae bacterium]